MTVRQPHREAAGPRPPEGLEAPRRKYQRLAWIAGTVVVLDQVTKWIILTRLDLYHTIPVVPGFFNIVHVQNPGGAFGFLAQQSPLVRGLVFLLMSTLAVCLIFWFYRNTPSSHRLLAAGFALIFGGAIGNLIDRVRLGQVVDFLDFYIGTWHWPAFNVADSGITVGIAIFLLHVVLGRMPE
ncbi:MAG: signal peptidase II [Desulfobacterales bacterium]|jgi:signal peptidase II